MTDKTVRESYLCKLKINVKSLAAEARFNRLEKNRASVGWIKWELDAHRTGPLRQEARVAQLAYAFVRGVPYRVVESSVKDPSSMEYVRKLVGRKLQRMGCPSDDTVLKNWFTPQHEACAA